MESQKGIGRNITAVLSGHSRPARSPEMQKLIDGERSLFGPTRDINEIVRRIRVMQDYTRMSGFQTARSQHRLLQSLPDDILPEVLARCDAEGLIVKGRLEPSQPAVRDARR